MIAVKELINKRATTRAGRARPAIHLNSALVRRKINEGIINREIFNDDESPTAQDRFHNANEVAGGMTKDAIENNDWIPRDASRVASVLLADTLKSKGGRSSSKRAAFETVQSVINELGLKSSRRVSFRAVAKKLGVATSTLSRWINEGHLKHRRENINWGGYGSRAGGLPENRGRQKKTETIDIEKMERQFPKTQRAGFTTSRINVKAVAQRLGVSLEEAKRYIKGGR
jgi:hypothetical protein